MGYVSLYCNTFTQLSGGISKLSYLLACLLSGRVATVLSMIPQLINKTRYVGANKL